MKKRKTSKTIRPILMLRVYPAGWTLLSAHLTPTYNPNTPGTGPSPLASLTYRRLIVLWNAPNAPPSLMGLAPFMYSRRRFSTGILRSVELSF
jgi:hypothetical protein